eukprot:gene578-1109_t
MNPLNDIVPQPQSNLVSAIIAQLKQSLGDQSCWVESFKKYQNLPLSLLDKDFATTDWRTLLSKNPSDWSHEEINKADSIRNILKCIEDGKVIPSADGSELGLVVTANAEDVFVAELTSAINGQHLLDATEKYASKDKTNGSIAYNRAKKVLVDNNLIPADRFAKGGYGKMARRDRAVIHAAIKAAEGDLLQELRHSLLPPTKVFTTIITKRSLESGEYDSQPYKKQTGTVSQELVNSAIADMERTQKSQAVHNAQVQLLLEQSLTVKAQRFREAISDKSFELFPIELQEKMKESYFNVITGGMNSLDKNVGVVNDTVDKIMNGINITI